MIGLGGDELAAGRRKHGLRRDAAATRRHLNTLVLDGSLVSKLVNELIDHTYELVAAALPKKRTRGKGK